MTRYPRLAARLAVVGVLSAGLCAPALAAPAVNPPTPDTGAWSEAAAPREVATASGPLAVEVARIAPLVLTATDTLTLDARVTNASGSALEGVVVELLAQEWTPNTRAALARWLDPDIYRASAWLAAGEVGTLQAGESATVTLAVPASAFGFTTWGPRGLEVRAGTTTPGVEPARLRTWTVHWDEPDVAPTRLGLLAPVTPTADELAGDADPADRLRSLAPALAHDGVTPVVDPGLLADSAELPAALRGRDALALPWADADVAALAADGTPPLTAALRERGREAWSAAGVAEPRAAAWMSAPDATTLGALPAADVALVSSGDFPQLAERSYTPDAVATLAGHTAVVVDDGLSDILAGRAGPEPEAHRLTAVEQRQYLAAATAVVTRERPGTSRLVVAALPRQGGGAVAGVLETVEALPWVEPAEVGEAIATVPADAIELDEAALPERAALPDGAMPPATTHAVAATLRELEAVGAVARDPAAVVDPLRDRLLRLTGIAWRERPGDRSTELEEVRAEVAAISDGIAVASSSTINMISESTNFPVTVANGLAMDVKVAVRLLPSDPRLRQVEPKLLDIPANSTVTAQVPVVAVGSADLEVGVQLTTPLGDPLGPPSPVSVRLRADWENIALVTLVAASGLAFVYGIIRTVRRNRQTGRAARIEAAVEMLDARDAGQG